MLHHIKVVLLLSKARTRRKITAESTAQLSKKEMYYVLASCFWWPYELMTAKTSYYYQQKYQVTMLTAAQLCLPWPTAILSWMCGFMMILDLKPSDFMQWIHHRSPSLLFNTVDYSHKHPQECRFYLQLSGLPLWEYLEPNSNSLMNLLNSNFKNMSGHNSVTGHEWER